jgi:hypothetical protein
LRVVDSPVRYDSIETLIFDQPNHRPLAVIDAAIWPKVGDVIELANPKRDAVVIGVRLQLAQEADGGRATVLVLVQDGEPGDTIDREPTVESLLEPMAECIVEPVVPTVIERASLD